MGFCEDKELLAILERVGPATISTIMEEMGIERGSITSGQWDSYRSRVCYRLHSLRKFGMVEQEVTPDRYMGARIVKWRVKQ